MPVTHHFLGFRLNKLFLRGGALLSMGLLSACINPPVTNTAAQAPVAHAPNVPVVDASVNTQHMAHTATQVTAPVAAAIPAAPNANLQGHLLQAGTFAMRGNADTVAATIRNKLPQFAHLVQVRERGSNWRVLIGGFANEHIRAQAAQAIRSVTAYDVANAAP